MACAEAGSTLQDSGNASDGIRRIVVERPPVSQGGGLTQGDEGGEEEKDFHETVKATIRNNNAPEGLKANRSIQQVHPEWAIGW